MQAINCKQQIAITCVSGSACSSHAFSISALRTHQQIFTLSLRACSVVCRRSVPTLCSELHCSSFPFFTMLQAIGCYGAVRMNEKLLNIYWNILVILLFGDAIVGVVWLFRYNALVATLKSDLKAKLNTDYGRDPSFRVSMIPVLCAA